MLKKLVLGILFLACVLSSNFYASAANLPSADEKKPEVKTQETQAEETVVKNIKTDNLEIELNHTFDEGATKTLEEKAKKDRKDIDNLRAQIKEENAKESTLGVGGPNEKLLKQLKEKEKQILKSNPYLANQIKIESLEKAIDNSKGNYTEQQKLINQKKALEGLNEGEINKVANQIKEYQSKEKELEDIKKKLEDPKFEGEAGQSSEEFISLKAKAQELTNAKNQISDKIPSIKTILDSAGEVTEKIKQKKDAVSKENNFRELATEQQSLQRQKDKNLTLTAEQEKRLETLNGTGEGSVSEAKESYEKAAKEAGAESKTPSIEKDAETAGESQAKSAEKLNNLTKSGDNILESNFTVKLGQIAVAKAGISNDMTTNQKANYFFGNFIQKLMVILGSLSMLVIVIGAGHMIMYSGEDGLLSKGKSIITSGIVALIIALSSYLLVAFVRWAIYATQ